jgi:hypothetical protein
MQKHRVALPAALLSDVSALGFGACMVAGGSLPEHQPPQRCCRVMPWCLCLVPMFGACAVGRLSDWYRRCLCVTKLFVISCF